MISKMHVHFTTGALAFAAALEAGVDVVGSQDLTWNVIAVAAAVVVQTFVGLYAGGSGSDTASTPSTEE